METLKANELRIGNWISNPHTKKDSQATIENISDIQNGFMQRVGIPLTEEWLFRFGFTNIDEGEFHKDWKFKGLKIRYKKDIEKYIVGIWDNSDDDCQIIWLDFVHQLQNLYALTGNELTIKS